MITETMLNFASKSSEIELNIGSLLTSHGASAWEAMPKEPMLLVDVLLGNHTNVLVEILALNHTLLAIINFLLMQLPSKFTKPNIRFVI